MLKILKKRCLQDGTTVEGEYLVGCDGVRERTHQLIEPTFPGAVFTGLNNSGSYTSGVKVPSQPETAHFLFCKMIIHVPARRR